MRRRLRARLRLIVTFSSFPFSCAGLAACTAGFATTAPAESVTPAAPEANPLGDDPDVIPFDRSTAYLRGFA